MAQVTLKNVVKKYDTKTIINDISLEIKDKEFLVLVGSSGCGKSTILRMIAGLEDITSGEIYIGDRCVNNVHPKDRDIAFVFQSYALYPHMSVYENIAFPLKMRNFSKDEIDKKVKEAAQILDLTEYLQRKPKQLSGGQRQRVALGRAIVRSPKVFLMDEPLSNLDAKLRVQMRSEIKKLHEKLQTTFIYVTHDQTEALTMGDRIVVLDKGVIQQVGTPEELYRRPCSPFVAGFIGTPKINLLSCIVQRSSSQAFACFDGLRTPLSPDCAFPAGPALLGVRPEDLILQEGGGPDSLTARVELVEMTGGDNYIHLTAGQSRLTLKCSSRLHFAVGQEISFSIPTDRVLLFPPEQS